MQYDSDENTNDENGEDENGYDEKQMTKIQTN